MSSLDPLELFRAELKEDDHDRFIQLMHKIGVIAVAAGAERARTELLPILDEIADKDENDEARAIIAQQMGCLVPHVGGAEHGHVLLVLLEKLASVEETVVRHAAVESLVRIVSQLPMARAQQDAYAMLKRLAGETWFYPRLSACGLFATMYPMATDEQQRELLAFFNNLCNDLTPMVRKAAYTHLGELSHNVQKKRVKDELIPIIRNLAKDELEAMRLHVVECCADVAKVLDEEECKDLILPIVEQLYEEPSWNVRQRVAKSMEKMCRNFGSELASAALMPIFAKLLIDTDPNVRLAAATALHKVASLAPVDIVNHLAPTFDELAADSNEKVRIAFAESIVHLAGPFGADSAQKLLVPILQTLAKDDHARVRNSIITNVDLLAQGIGTGAFTDQVLPTVTEMWEDAKWRVRCEVIAKVSSIAENLADGKFEHTLLPMVFAALTDHVFAVREQACVQIAKLTQVLGEEWAAEHLLTKSMECYTTSTNYLHRMTSLLIAAELAELKALSSETFSSFVLPVLVKACGDVVPNVRFTAARTLHIASPQLSDQVVSSQIVPALTTLTSDPDVDVKYFAEQALKVANKA
jgi:serine/threonine-protein phosphatase 2A regulatory subunit A